MPRMPEAPRGLSDAEVGLASETPHGLSDAEVGLSETPAAPSAVETRAVRAGKVALQGAGHGVADIVGMPGDYGGAWMDLTSRLVAPVINAFMPPDKQVEPFNLNDAPTADKLAEATANAAHELTGYEPVTPEGIGEKGIRNMARYGTQGAVGGAATGGMRFAGPAADAALGSEAGVALRALPIPSAASARVVPTGKYVAMDALSGAGSGAGVTAAEATQKDEKLSPAAEAVAAILGGVTTAGAAKGITQAGRAVRSVGEYTVLHDPAVREFLNPGEPAPTVSVAEKARAMMQGAAGGQRRMTIGPEEQARAKEAADNIRTGAREYRDAGMTPPTSDLLSKNYGVMGLGRGARNTDPARFIERDAQIQNDAADRARSLRPEGANPRAATDFAANEARALEDAAQSRQNAAQSQVDQAMQSEQDIGGQIGARRGTDTSASVRLSGAVDTAKAADEARKAGLYREAETLGRNTQIDPTDLAENARAIRDEISPLAAQDSALNNVIRDLDRLSPEQTPGATYRAGDTGAPLFPPEKAAPISATDLIAMRPRLSQAREAAVRLRRGDVVERLDRVNGMIGDKLDNLAASGDPAALKWQEAEQNFRTDFAPKYREGVGAQLDKAERAGTPVEPSAVAGRFLHPYKGGQEAASDLSRILTDAKTHEEGMAAARDYVLADMAKIVGADGRINPARLRAWIADRSGLFESMPNLRAEAEQALRNVMNRRNATTGLQRDLEAATQGVTRTKAEIQNSATGLLLGKDPQKAVQAVFGSGDPEKAMAEVAAKLGKDPEAAAGWKAAVSDWLWSRIKNPDPMAEGENAGKVSFAKIDRFFDQNANTLTKVYSPEEMMSLQRVRKAVRDLARANVKAMAGSDTAANLVSMNDIIGGALRLRYGMLKGAGIHRILKTWSAKIPGLVGNDERVSELVTRAMFDPELAAHLLETPLKQAGPSAQWISKTVAILQAKGLIQDAARDRNSQNTEGAK